MKGKHIDALNVLIRNQTNDSSIWSRKGNQGSNWKLAVVNFELVEQNVITFEAVRGTGYEVEKDISANSSIDRICK